MIRFSPESEKVRLLLEIKSMNKREGKRTFTGEGIESVSYIFSGMKFKHSLFAIELTTPSVVHQAGEPRLINDGWNQRNERMNKM